MGLVQLLVQNPAAFVAIAGLLLYSVILHEISHGFAALAFGDTTARDAGRLSLDPRSHVDPLGLLALFLVGFGWARPVPVNYARLGGNSAGLIVVSLAGCFTNLLIAMAALVVLQTPLSAGHPLLAAGAYFLVRINIVLCAFNLIPIPPLDGSRVLLAILPPAGKMRLAALEPYGFFIILALLLTGMLTPLISFIQNVLSWLIIGVFSLFHF